MRLIPSRYRLRHDLGTIQKKLVVTPGGASDPVRVRGLTYHVVKNGTNYSARGVNHGVVYAFNWSDPWRVDASTFDQSGAA